MKNYRNFYKSYEKISQFSQKLQKISQFFQKLQKKLKNI